MEIALSIMDINEFHNRLGHMNIDMTKKIAKSHNISLVGNLMYVLPVLKSQQGKQTRDIQIKPNQWP